MPSPLAGTHDALAGKTRRTEIKQKSHLMSAIFISLGADDWPRSVSLTSLVQVTTSATVGCSTSNSAGRQQLRAQVLKTPSLSWEIQWKFQIPHWAWFSPGCYWQLGNEPVDIDLSVYNFLCHYAFPIHRILKKKSSSCSWHQDSQQIRQQWTKRRIRAKEHCATLVSIVSAFMVRDKIVSTLLTNQDNVNLSWNSSNCQSSKSTFQ